MALVEQSVGQRSRRDCGAYSCRPPGRYELTVLNALKCAVRNRFFFEEEEEEEGVLKKKKDEPKRALKPSLAEKTRTE
jgi:hypothetical protein